MLFTHIILTNFKNYTSARFDFRKRVIGICGLNGKGKTNLLDALYYLCFTRSYFSRKDQMNVNFKSSGFRLEAEVENKNKIHKVVCIFRENNKKEVSLNESGYDKLSHHIGKFPCVFIGPDDIALINGGSEQRRKYLDTLFSQIDGEYLRQLIIYNKLLVQRNGLLKYEAKQHTRDKMLLSSIDDRMIVSGSHIYEKRAEFVQKLFPLIRKFYSLISGKEEQINLQYESQLQDKSYKNLLAGFSEKDRMTLRTNGGIHRDDVLFDLKENLFRQVASQGQRKSLLFACKLAEFEILKEIKGFAPVLLLDDVFEKLDDNRVQHLLHYIFEQNNGQVFITDTNAGRLSDAVSAFRDELQIINLE